MSGNKVYEDNQNRLSELVFAYRKSDAAKRAQYQTLIEQYSAALAELSGPYHALPASQPEILTIPKIFNKSHNENFISDYLAYILNPKRNGIGNQPLNILMELISPEIELRDFQKVEIIREYPLHERRIDILILIDDMIVIGLENKIFAFESQEQTVFYAQALDQFFQNRERLYAFLTIEGKAAYSDKFRALSYQQLLTAFQAVQFPAGDFKKRTLWEDFLMHMEIHLTMNSKKLDIPEPEKLSLYLKHHKMLSDLRSAYEGSREAVFNTIAQDIQKEFGNWDWIFNFNPARDWQLMYKPHWYLKKPPIRVMLVMWFTREILLANDFLISIEVQGYEKEWDTQEEIPQFFNLFEPRFNALKTIYKEKGIFYLTALPERPLLAKLCVAWKRYPVIFNTDQVETISAPIIIAIEEFMFLLAPIEETLQEINVE